MEEQKFQFQIDGIPYMVNIIPFDFNQPYNHITI